MIHDGFVLGDGWTVWDCRRCVRVDGVTWVKPSEASWQQRVDGGRIDVVTTHRARRMSVNWGLRWVLIDPLNDTEMRAGTWLDTIPMEAIRGLTVREIPRPRALWFDRLFGRRPR
jgi:hypothetical protein